MNSSTLVVPVTLRPANLTGTERHFILRSWLDSYFQADARHLSPEAQWIPKHVFYKSFNTILNGIINRPSVTCTVAVNPEDDDHLFGFIVSERLNGLPILHYIYVKFTFRRFGIASALFADAFHDEEPVVCTFANHTYRFHRRKYKLLYNPFLRVP